MTMKNPINKRDRGFCEICDKGSTDSNKVVHRSEIPEFNKNTGGAFLFYSQILCRNRVHHLCKQCIDNILCFIDDGFQSIDNNIAMFIQKQQNGTKHVHGNEKSNKQKKRKLGLRDIASIKDNVRMLLAQGYKPKAYRSRKGKIIEVCFRKEDKLERFTSDEYTTVVLPEIVFMANLATAELREE